MNLLAFFLTAAVAFAGNSQGSGLEEIRRNYQQAVTDKKLCARMIRQLGDHAESDIHLAYLGGFQALWARHTLNPATKLRTFSDGKRNIDKAAGSAPANPEIVFVRHSVQKNSPAFLGYKDHVGEDSMFLSRNLREITSPRLKQMIENLLKD